ncbi:MAG: hypothetical protein HPY69_20835 [Armatimonadetes bacterium]|nr:hypothetical protein [Armatimonadota bacterium]
MALRASAWLSLLVVGACVGGDVAAQPNLIQNSSFEVGLGNWGWYTRGKGGYDRDVAVVSADPCPARVQAPEAPHGRHILRFAAPDYCAFWLSTRAYRTSPGPHALRLNVRTDIPLTVSVADGGRHSAGEVAQVSVAPGARWQTVEGAWSVPPGTSLITLSVSGTGPGTVELDRVIMGPQEGQPTPPVELGLEPSEGRQILFPGEPVRLAVRCFSDLPFSGVLSYRVENAWGGEVAADTVTVEAGEAGLVEVPLTLELPATGHYRLLAQVRHGTATLSATEELLLAVVPRRPLPTSTEDADGSRFGCNMESRPWLMEVAQAIGMRWVFCNPPVLTKWFCVEPRPGEWRFFDEVVAEFEARGLRLVGNLADPPAWVTDPQTQERSGPWPNPVIPPDLKLWDEYVRRVVSHYRPHIAHWAPWNEPNHPGFLQLSEGESWEAKYITLLSRTHAVVKAVDERLQVVGGTVTNPGAFPPLVLAGGLEYMDVGAFHWASWTPDGYIRQAGDELGLLGPKETWVNCTEWIRDAFAQVGRSVPLWNTECHITEADVEREFRTQPHPAQYYGTPRMTALDAANAIPRQHIAEWAAGVEKTFYWLLATYDSAREGRAAKTLLEWDRSPTAALVAYAVMTDQLAGAELLDWKAETREDLLERPTIWTFRFRKPGGTLTVVWSNRDVETEITLPVAPARTRVFDLFGAERAGAGSMSGLPLTDRIVLRVARSPFYVFEAER